MKNSALKPWIPLALALLALGLSALPALAAGKKKKAGPAPAPTVSAAPSPSSLTNYYCTIWNEVAFDSAAAPALKQASNMPIPHMGKIAIYKET